MLTPGLDRGDLDYCDGVPFGPSDLHTEAARTEYVKRVVETQFEFATMLTAPHFFAEDASGIDLNIDLVARTAAQAGDMPLRAVPTVTRALFRQLEPILIAKKYRLAGATQIDLRIPLLAGLAF